MTGSQARRGPVAAAHGPRWDTPSLSSICRSDARPSVSRNGIYTAGGRQEARKCPRSPPSLLLPLASTAETNVTSSTGRAPSAQNNEHDLPHTTLSPSHLRGPPTLSPCVPQCRPPDVNTPVSSNPIRPPVRLPPPPVVPRPGGGGDLLCHDAVGRRSTPHAAPPFVVVQLVESRPEPPSLYQGKTAHHLCPCCTKVHAEVGRGGSKRKKKKQ